MSSFATLSRPANAGAVSPYRWPIISRPLALVTSNDDGDGQAKPLPFGEISREPEELPYKIELWDAAKLFVELVLAVTANGSIGYAAYYAALREYPDRFITLRHKGKTLSSWNGPAQ